MSAVRVALFLCVSYSLVHAEPKAGTPPPQKSDATVETSDASELRLQLTGINGATIDIASDPLIFDSKKNKLPPVVIKYDHGDPTQPSFTNWKHRLDIVQLDHGDRAETGDVSADNLAAVIRLLKAGASSSSDLVCTGTAVNWGDEQGILTAAHCLYEAGPGDTIGPVLRPALRVQALGIDVPTSAARIPASFKPCVGLHYQECNDLGALDVAFIPARLPTTWNVCTEQASTTNVVGFGYGLDVSHLPTDLLKGYLQLTGDHQGSLFKAESTRHQQVNSGDSGGPVIADYDDTLLAFRTPSVCFVAAARRDAFSLLQPVWMLTAALDTAP